MFGPVAFVKVEKLCILEYGGELRMSGTKLMEGGCEVNGLGLRFIGEFTLGGEGRASLIGSEHENALEKIHIREFISTHQWIRNIPFTLEN